MAIRKVRFPEQRERGYILITAIWLLLLGASIVSLLMLKNLNRGEEISYEREQIELRYAQESAVETVIADMLFNGPRGEFVQLPAETSYQFGEKEMHVRVTSESGKIDVNQADPALMDRALRGLGISSIPRQNFLSEVQLKRAGRKQFQSTGDVENAMDRAGIATDAEFCMSRYFTVYSGLVSPQTGQMDARLAQALGQPNLEAAGKATPGIAMKLAVTSSDGLPLNAIVRTSGLVGESHFVLDWRYEIDCD